MQCCNARERNFIDLLKFLLGSDCGPPHTYCPGGGHESISDYFRNITTALAKRASPGEHSCIGFDKGYGVCNNRGINVFVHPSLFLYLAFELDARAYIHLTDVFAITYSRNHTSLSYNIFASLYSRNSILGESQKWPHPRHGRGLSPPSR